MYILGFAGSYAVYRYFQKKGYLKLSQEDISNLIVIAFLSLLIGARTFYVLFYNFSYFLANPLSYFEVWKGGLSFHGALVGIIIGVAWYLWKKQIPILPTADLLILPIPFALFFGRLGNFINGELFGRIVSPDAIPFCVVFPAGGPECRIPSQLLEASGEGLLLGLLLWLLYFKTPLRNKPGVIFGLFLAGYGVIRFLIEYVRQPDSQVGLLWDVISMGQLLCLPMIIAGIAVMFWKRRG